jgi:hypothetical protein
MEIFHGGLPQGGEIVSEYSSSRIDMRAAKAPISVKTGQLVRGVGYRWPAASARRRAVNGRDMACCSAPGRLGVMAGSGEDLRAWLQAVGEGGVAASGALGADRCGQGAAGSGQHDQFLGPGDSGVAQVVLQHHP